MTTTIELIKIRKVCTNCKMNALHTNRHSTWDGQGYGSTVTYTKTVSCENCGKVSK